MVSTLSWRCIRLLQFVQSNILHVISFEKYIWKVFCVMLSCLRAQAASKIGVKLRHLIFVGSGWRKGVTERRQEPSRICTRLKIALQKNRKIRCLLKEYWGLFQGHLYLASSDKIVFEKSMSVLSISGYQLKRRQRRKSVVLRNRGKIFRDDNHQSFLQEN